MEILRMCIACRNMIDKKSLHRIVKNKEGKVSVDKTFRANGRGAYLCMKSECVELARKKNLLDKALKTKIDDKIYEELSGCAEQ